MNELLVISIGGGLILGAVATAIGALLLHYLGNTITAGIDIDLYYAEMDELKRASNAERLRQGRGTAVTLRSLLIQYGIAVSVIMILMLRIVLALPLTLSAAVLAVLLIWLLVGGTPIAIMMMTKMKQIAILEMSSVLESLVRSDDDTEEWIIRASKAVFGGDLFGDDQEDSLELHVTRTNFAPIALSISGHVLIANNGLERTVSKSALRQLRLKGWFVDEPSSTEAIIKHEWSLHDSTYADIANDISRIVESLGFSVRNLRIRKGNTDATVHNSQLVQAEKASATK